MKVEYIRSKIRNKEVNTIEYESKKPCGGRTSDPYGGANHIFMEGIVGKGGGTSSKHIWPNPPKTSKPGGSR